MCRRYRLASSVIVDRCVVLKGETATGWYGQSILHAEPGVTALIISNGPTDFVTPPGPGGGPGDGTAAWSTIRDLVLYGPGAGLNFPPVGATAHGVKILVTCELINIYATGFTGDAFHHVATSGIEGNAGTVAVTKCFGEYSRGNGFFIQGGDVNASVYTACSA